MTRVLTLALALAIGCGCAHAPVLSAPSTTTTTITSTTSTTTTTLPFAPAAVRRAAVIVGIAVTTTGLACPGADVDARTVERWVADRPTTVLMDGQATRPAIQAALRMRAAGFGPDDLLTFAISGHGTQRRDTSGDEADDMDEGAVTGDGAVWCDDDVWRFISTLPPCRIELITDTCHAEGNWRRFARAMLPAALEPAPRWVQLELDLGDQRAVPWGGRLSQFAGCRENSYSYGDTTGGTLTQTMDRKRRPGITRKAWFDAINAAMPSEQKPVYAEYGESMADGEALQ